MTKNVNRRKFMSAAAVSGMALAPIKAQVASDKPALLGGTRIRNKPFPSWPVVAETDEKAVAAVVRSARWGRFPGGECGPLRREISGPHRSEVLRRHKQWDQRAHYVAGSAGNRGGR